MNKLTVEQQKELERLSQNSDINTSDIPATADWSKAERGRFYRPGAVHQAIRYRFTWTRTCRASWPAMPEKRQIDASALANELLRKDAELIGLVFGG